MNELCTKLKYRLIMLSCTEISFDISLFSVVRNFESNRGFLLRNSIELILKTWKKLILTCLKKIIAEQSSVIQICVINVSYERKIIVLSFPVISFVILIFIFQIFEIKSGFPFY